MFRDGVLGDVNKNSIHELWPIGRELYDQQIQGHFFPPCDRCLRFDDGDIDWYDGTNSRARYKS